MTIAVAGLWHLGSVTAACLAKLGFDVVGIDDAPVVAGLAAAKAPLFEPQLDALIAEGIAAGRLRFYAPDAAPLDAVDLLWVAYDTPVDDEDRADVGHVVSRVTDLLPRLRDGAVVLVSSQLPVGTVRRIAGAFAAAHPGRRLEFAYSPENLRLGKAIATFLEAERIVVGCASPAGRAALEPTLARFGQAVIWTGVEAAEMVKHTINAFLATSITFINEIAALCELVGADACEVEAGIRSDPRIGPRAYVSPGGAFGGGTLARDVAFLSEIAQKYGVPAPLVGAILPSNRAHAGWAFRRLADLLGESSAQPLAGRRVTLLGLTYKPGTSTLRRSEAVSLAERLLEAGAVVAAYDPSVMELPPPLAARIVLCPNSAAALAGADAAVVATEWPEFRKLQSPDLAGMRRRLVLDQSGFLVQSLGATADIAYLRVGKAG
jgi:UDPglucose 6-dehydrogenase